MKILLVGGGSGGHLTPLFAVQRTLAAIAPQARLEFWSDRKMRQAARERAAGRKVRVVISGKYRRYVGKRTPFGDRVQNLFDLAKIAFGVAQSFCRLLFYRPDVIFLKGGFVSVPVGIAAGWLHIPYIIHESDSSLGLANRLLAKRARWIALGLPPAKSDDARLVYTGVPIDPVWLQAPAEAEGTKPAVIILGGGLGAHSLNLEAAKIARHFKSSVTVTALIGQSESEKLERELNDLGATTYRFVAAADQLAHLVRAADLVITRAGATTIAELAAAKRAVILVAKATLPGAHQAKNADLLAEQGAAIAFDGSTLEQNGLPLLVEELLRDPARRRALATKLHALGRYDAAERLAKMLIELGAKR